ncbi:unnamed protein product [Alopecurus aequalis]
MEDAAAAEVEAAMHASKRRRVDDHQAPPGSGSRQEQRHRDDLIRQRLEALRDLIGRRVDNVLIRRQHDAIDAILSLLPTSQEQVLSRRWRPLWRSAPLNLVADCNLVNGDSQKRIAVISKILSSHPGPARCFLLRQIRMPDSLGEIDGWFRSRALDNLQELEVTYSTASGDIVYPLPPPVLRFSPTLRVVKFGCCRFPDVTVPTFPHLKRLTLYSTAISEDSLHNLLSACIALESLSLRYPIGIGCLRISSLTLRSMDFYASRTEECLQELIIEDVPCLERLIPLDPDDGPATIQVIRAPKLKILGLLSEGISTLSIGTTIFQKMIAVTLTTRMNTMKILVLDSVGPNLGKVVGFLKCFPCLEKLYVITHPKKDMNNVQMYDPIECLELHLKEVVLKNYDGNKKSSIDFAKFFILNAKVLKKMEIGVVNRRNEIWMSYQLRQLQVENSASRDAQIELKRDVGQNFKHHNHAHDFSMADPFDRPCGRLLQMY